MGLVNEKALCNNAPLIGWVYTQNDPCLWMVEEIVSNSILGSMVSH